MMIQKGKTVRAFGDTGQDFQKRKPPSVEVKKKRGGDVQALGSILEQYELDSSGKYISQEFQDFGYRLASELDDLKRVSLYMRLAKTVDRSILEASLRFVSDAKKVRNKAALFMWKMKQIRAGAKKLA